MSAEMMTGPAAPRLKTIKRLFALSGNRCAFPKCSAPLVDPGTGKVTGRICHIRGKSEGGPRFDPHQDNEARRGFENLLLMCPTHHDVIDADEAAYTVERLKTLKEAREADGIAVAEPDDDVAQQLLANTAAAMVVAAPVIGDLVISQNQSGGQTAHTIHNHGPPTRKLGTRVRREMLSILSGRASSVGFASTHSDPEAAGFKLLLMDVFREAGWEVHDMATFLFFESKRGLVVTIPFNAAESGTPQIVAEALSRTGNPVTGNRGDMANDCGVYVQVWHAPDGSG